MSLGGNREGNGLVALSRWAHRGTTAAFSLLVICMVATISNAGRADGDQIRPIYIAGVRLGMTQYQVHSVLGPPRFRQLKTYDGREWQWQYPGNLTVGFTLSRGHIRRVLRIRTRSPRDRFVRGIHVGMKEGRFRRRLYGEQCSRVTDSYGTTPKGWVCYWSPPWINYACGPQLIFYMSHHHGRIRYIELWGIPKRFQSGAPRRLLPDSYSPGAIAMRGCV